MAAVIVLTLVRALWAPSVAALVLSAAAASPGRGGRGGVPHAVRFLAWGVRAVPMGPPGDERSFVDYR